MERLHPGVYLEEVPSGVRPIEGVSTSTAAFIGKAELGTVSKAFLVTGVAEFEKKYGTFLEDSYLAHAVYQFFNNGGRKCYIVRVASGARAASIAIKDRKSVPVKRLTVRAVNEGTWGDSLDVEIADGHDDPDNEFALRLYRAQPSPLPPLLLETHENLSMNPGAANYVVKKVAAASAYIAVDVVDPTALNAATNGSSRSGRLQLVGDAAAALKLGVANGGTETAGADSNPSSAGPPAVPATPATAGRSESGASPATSLLADQGSLSIELDGDGPQGITIPGDTAAAGAAIAGAIKTQVRNLKAATAANQPAYDGFDCTYETPAPPGNPFYRLTSGTTGAQSAVVVASGSAVPAGRNRLVIEVDRDGPHLINLQGALSDGPQIAKAIEDAVVQIATAPKRAANKTAFEDFKCTWETAAGAGKPSLLLKSGTKKPDSSVRVSDAPAANVAEFLKLGVTKGGRELTGASELRPANSGIPTPYHVGVALPAGNIDSVTAGDDGAIPSAQELVNGLSALDVVRDVNMVAIPGYGDVVADGMVYCGGRADCFFIGDTNRTDDSKEDALTFYRGLTTKNSYGAIYYPWLKMRDPLGRTTELIPAPPSGFIAGLYARIDGRRGVWKAPAGTEAYLGGAQGLMADTIDAEQDLLNPFGINVIRMFPTAGLVAWGARTLATDPEYRYIPVRRTAIFLEQSIYQAIQWAVFEPNDEDLWSSLRLNIGAFMLLQFRAGAFQGRTPSDAFFVKCDNQTTTQADIDAGVVNIVVGFAPLKPAEFVVLKLTQKAGQPA